jgi:anti-anti-sigma factor
VAANAEAAAIVRAQLRSWLAELGPDPIDIVTVVHAVSEYVENAAEHAYVDQQPGAISVGATLATDGTMRASVTDDGRWRTPSTDPSSRGRGLALADMFAMRSRVVSSSRGTTAELSHRLSRRVHIVTDPQIAHVRAGASAGNAFDVSVENGRIRVTGDVDIHSAPLLAGRITAESHSGTLPVTVDLTAVTHLGSAGISVLADASEHARRQGTDFSLIAPPGTTAHQVLSLVHLPVVTVSDPDLLN